MVIGLCGRMASGKSTALRIFAAHGLNVLDCDDVARETVAPGSECLAELTRAFGEDIIADDGSLDRKRLAKTVFPYPDRTALLNSITHRHIIARVLDTVREIPGDWVVAAPLMFESGFDAYCDETVCIIAPESDAAARTAGRFSAEDVRERLSRQLPEEYLISRCGHVLYNDGTVGQLEERIELLMRELGVGK
ncbi:MAG: dephospho-CoA kinase [Clostridiales bacterium]|nr:dephospho-CoA kinase [Clostridiales bacterium]